MFVKPADPAAKVPVPGAPAHERWLPPEGREVPDDEYWRRLVANRDVLPANPPKSRKE